MVPISDEDPPGVGFRTDSMRQQCGRSPNELGPGAQYGNGVITDGELSTELPGDALEAEGVMTKGEFTLPRSNILRSGRSRM
jgi:hypothetical protein